MIKAAYLLGQRSVSLHGNVTRQLYKFTPWCEVDETDWPELQAKKRHIQKCCGKPGRVDRVFGSEQEIRDGQVATFWR